MTNDLVRSKLESTLRVKSLGDLVRAKSSEIIYLLIDVSGSMDAQLRNGKIAVDVLRDVVRDIRLKRDDVKLIAFGGRDGGAYEVSVVPNAAGGTPLHRAIDLATEKKAGRAIVISDGCPDSTIAAMDAAGRFGGQIDVVYVGDPGDAGERFLQELAKRCGGTEFTGDLSKPKELTSAVIGLLTEGGEPESRGSIKL